MYSYILKLMKYFGVMTYPHIIVFVMSFMLLTRGTP